jgi:hypothetical protein
MARYKPGENKPDVIEGRCAGGCGRKGKARVFNKGLRGADVDNRDPSRGMKVKVDGRGPAKKVTGSKTIKGTHCYVLQDGTAIPINRCTEA